MLSNEIYDGPKKNNIVIVESKPAIKTSSDVVIKPTELVFIDDPRFNPNNQPCENFKSMFKWAIKSEHNERKTIYAHVDSCNQCLPYFTNINCNLGESMIEKHFMGINMNRNKYREQDIQLWLEHLLETKNGLPCWACRYLLMTKVKPTTAQKLWLNIKDFSDGVAIGTAARAAWEYDRKIGHPFAAFGLLYYVSKYK